MSKSKSIEERFVSILKYWLGVTEEIKPEQNLVDDLGADLPDLVEILMATEEEFEIEIDDDEAEKVETVQQAIDLINSKL